MGARSARKSPPCVQYVPACSRKPDRRPVAPGNSPQDGRHVIACRRKALSGRARKLWRKTIRPRYACISRGRISPPPIKCQYPHLPHKFRPFLRGLILPTPRRSVSGLGRSEGAVRRDRVRKGWASPGRRSQSFRLPGAAPLWPTAPLYMELAPGFYGGARNFVWTEVFRPPGLQPGELAGEAGSGGTAQVPPMGAAGGNGVHY